MDLNHLPVKGDVLARNGLTHEGDNEYEVARRDRRAQRSVGPGRGEQARR